MTADALYATDLPGLTLSARGKVRDVYDLGDTLLIVSTDRLSAFDCVFPDPIPDKGKVLNQTSSFWFERTAPWLPNHLLATDVASFPAPLGRHAETLSGRATLARKLTMLPVECVARGYLAGSGWKDYQATGRICGVALPRGLRESDALPEPIFTPSTKAATGHDENVTFDEVVRLVGGTIAERLRDLTVSVYRDACRHAASRGILIADTKLEFGFDDGTLTIGDEMLTPDSSRFWPAESYRPGGPQPSLDKQFVRDHVERIGWDKRPPAPRLPDDVIEGLRSRYLEIFRRLTGRELSR
jgi:phosphoribosylaminoimidazole-succinocarboxamide synthase